MEVGAVVIAKMNEAKRWCPFWGLENNSQNGSRILCVLWKAWLGISTPEMKICNRKPLNSDLKTLLAKRVLFHAIQNTEMAFCCGDPRLGRPQLAQLLKAELLLCVVFRHLRLGQSCSKVLLCKARRFALLVGNCPWRTFGCNDKAHGL